MTRGRGRRKQKGIQCALQPPSSCTSGGNNRTKRRVKVSADVGVRNSSSDLIRQSPSFPSLLASRARAASFLLSPLQGRCHVGAPWTCLDRARHSSETAAREGKFRAAEEDARVGRSPTAAIHVRARIRHALHGTREAWKAFSYVRCVVVHVRDGVWCEATSALLCIQWTRLSSDLRRPPRLSTTFGSAHCRGLLLPPFTPPSPS